MDNLNNSLEKLIRALISIGFGEEQAKKQINNLGEIIIKSFLKRVHEENPKLNFDDQFPETIRKELEDEYLEKVLVEVSQNLLQEYINEITSDLSEQEKDSFLALIK